MDARQDSGMEGLKEEYCASGWDPRLQRKTERAVLRRRRGPHFPGGGGSKIIWRLLFFACALSFLAAPDWKAGTMSQQQQLEVRYQSVDRMRIAYVEQGQGAPLVLVHGQFGDHLDWEPVIAPLARHFRVIAVDLPGFGDSDKPDREYDADFLTGSLHGLLKTLGIRRSILAGNSFGGQIAILYTLRYPDEVSRLILADSGGFREVTSAEKQFYTQRLSPEFLAGLTPETQRPLFAPIFAKQGEIRERYLNKQDAKLKREDFPAYARSLARCIALALDLYLLERLPEIKAPVLVLWGDRDFVLPVEQARKAMEKLRRGKLKVFEGCGHAPQLDCPQEFAQAVKEFATVGVQ
jgi:pimeloyl-ACP methyl ester carboxylesterase